MTEPKLNKQGLKLGLNQDNIKNINIKKCISMYVQITFRACLICVHLFRLLEIKLKSTGTRLIIWVKEKKLD